MQEQPAVVATAFGEQSRGCPLPPQPAASEPPPPTPSVLVSGSSRFWDVGPARRWVAGRPRPRRHATACGCAAGRRARPSQEAAWGGRSARPRPRLPQRPVGTLPPRPRRPPRLPFSTQARHSPAPPVPSPPLPPPSRLRTLCRPLLPPGQPAATACGSGVRGVGVWAVARAALRHRPGGATRPLWRGGPRPAAGAAAACAVLGRGGARGRKGGLAGRVASAGRGRWLFWRPPTLWVDLSRRNK